MGPGVSIILSRSPTDSDVAALDEIARSLGTANESAADFHVETTVPIGGTTSAGEGGRPFVAGFEDLQYDGSEIEAIIQEFGFVSVSLIGVGAMCNAEVDHRILGELAAHLAERFEGLVGFNGLLGVDRVRSGKLSDLPYEVDGRRLTSNVGDLEFLLGWLSDPAFHMIK